MVIPVTQFVDAMKVTDARLIHCKNASFSMVMTDAGMTMEVIAVSRNALIMMIWSSLFSAKVTDVRLVHDLNAPPPMDVTDAGMTMEVIAVDWNALNSIAVHPVPSSTTVGRPDPVSRAWYMALVKVVLPPEVYAMSTILKEAYYRVHK
jgi:hypothetical protein